MFKNNKILILGFARSGYEAAKVLAKRGNDIVVTDGKSNHNQEKIKELEDLGVRFVLGENPIELVDKSVNYLIKNPGVPINHEYVVKARELNIEVINEVEMAYRLFPEGIKLIGITGTNGKTTTTTLIYEMIKKDGKSVYLTGNIGFPLCSFLDKLNKDDIVVMETSCQQLENLYRFKPDIAIMTNLFEAHIDFFNTYDAYKKVKAKIFKNHTEDDIAILNIENEDVISVTKDIKSKVRYFSSNKEINGCYIKDAAIYYYEEKIVDLSDIKLVGYHNYENIMASILVVKELGVSNESIVSLLKEFGGVEHRVEFVRELNKRRFYNDSKATNITSTQIALSAFNDSTIIILGGMERGQDFNELKDYMKNVKFIVCYGECRDRIKEFGDSLGIETKVFDNLREAINSSYDLSSEDDVILLSPCAASWDQYKDFEERGNEFKQIVNELE